MKNITAFMLISASLCMGDGLKWERAKPCFGEISKISTKNLIEYHSFRTAKGDKIFACEMNGTLHISESSMAKIGKERADKIMSEYNTLFRFFIEEYFPDGTMTDEGIDEFCELINCKELMIEEE